MPDIPATPPEGRISVYDAVADVDAYAVSTGNSAWAGATEDERRIARVRASIWLNGLPWKGQRAERDQVDAWGRTGVVDDDGYAWEADEMPQGVAAAFCEMCFVFLGAASGSNPDPFVPVAERGRVVTSERVDVVQFTYGDELAMPIVRDSRTGFPVVDGMLAGLIRSGGKFGQVEVRRG